MRFQTTRRVQGQDPELVLGVLEGCLRSVSPEIVRQGSRITLLGLGPSPRAINRRDTTIIDVQREDGATVIHADVRFQASAFLGTAAQDIVVQEKLDRIFDEMLARLGVSAPSEPEKVDSVECAVPVVAKPEVAAQQISAETPIEETAAPDTTAAADETATSAATPDPVSESRAEGEVVAAAPEQAEIVTEPAVPSPSNKVEPESTSAEPERQEELPAAATPEVTASSATSAVATDKPEDIVPAPLEVEDTREAPSEAVEAVTVADAKLPEPVKATDAADADRAASVEEDSAAANVETASRKDEETPAKLEPARAKVGPVEAEAAPVANVIEPKALPSIESSTQTTKEEPAKREAPAGAARITPQPSGEAAKPLPAPVAKIEAAAKFSKPAAAESKPSVGIRKPEAKPSSVSKTALPTKGPSSAIVSKPVLPKGTAPPVASSTPTFAGSSKGMFGVSTLEEEPEASSKLLKWSAWIAALIVLVVAPVVWLYMPSHPQSAAAPVTHPAATAPAEPVATPKQPGEDADPAVVVDDWAAAMNSRDAAAQAAFYANPVERYFLRHNLSRDQVKADKQAAIDRRKGDWAVKMESIKVTRPDDKTARARLIKHYTVKEDGKTASEWFVPSVLQMTLENGRWQITSERDLGWATSLDELGY